MVMDGELDDLDLQQHIDAALSNLGLDDEIAMVAAGNNIGELEDADNQHERTRGLEFKLEQEYERLSEDLLGDLKGAHEGSKSERVLGPANPGLGEDLIRAIAKLDARYTRIIKMLQHEIGQCQAQRERVITSGTSSEGHEKR